MRGNLLTPGDFLMSQKMTSFWLQFSMLTNPMSHFWVGPTAMDPGLKCPNPFWQLSGPRAHFGPKLDPFLSYSHPYDHPSSDHYWALPDLATSRSQLGWLPGSRLKMTCFEGHLLARSVKRGLFSETPNDRPKPPFFGLSEANP